MPDVQDIDFGAFPAYVAILLSLAALFTSIAAYRRDQHRYDAKIEKEAREQASQVTHHTHDGWVQGVDDPVTGIKAGQPLWNITNSSSLPISELVYAEIESGNKMGKVLHAQTKALLQPQQTWRVGVSSPQQRSEASTFNQLEFTDNDGVRWIRRAATPVQPGGKIMSVEEMNDHWAGQSKAKWYRRRKRPGSEPTDRRRAP